MNVANLLTTKGQSAVTIRPAQSVSDAVSLLAEKGLGALVVVDQEGRPIGIVTERHIVRRLAADHEVLIRTVGETMSRDLLTATPQDELSAVLFLMTERRIRHMQSSTAMLWPGSCRSATCSGSSVISIAEKPTPVRRGSCAPELTYGIGVGVGASCADVQPWLSSADGSSDGGRQPWALPPQAQGAACW
jgi:hypothetical protein